MILEHLERRFPDPPLYPADPARREEMRVFIDWFNRVWKGPPNEYLVGDALTAADLMAFPFLRYAVFCDPEDTETFHQVLTRMEPDLQRHAGLLAWIERLRALPMA